MAKYIWAQQMGININSTGTDLMQNKVCVYMHRYANECYM